jgi:hypothetical protein
MQSEAEINERWERAWADTSDFERRRYRSLDAASKLAVLMLVPSSAGLTLGEAISLGHVDSLRGGFASKLSGVHQSGSSPAAQKGD